MIIVFKYVFFKRFIGITLWPFILVKHNELRYDFNFINHEYIHLRQQLELLVIPFYIIYLLEFILKLIWYKDWELAYYNISFEKEAYQNSTNKLYLKQRSIWTFIRYF